MTQLKKWTWDLNRVIKRRKMAKKYTKKCLSSLSIKKTQSKGDFISHLAEWPRSPKQLTTNVGKATEKEQLSFTVGNKMVYLFWKTKWTLFSRLNPQKSSKLK